MKTGGSEGERELETRWRASEVLWVFRKNTAVVEDVERHWGTTLPGKVYMGVFFYHSLYSKKLGNINSHFK